MPFRDCLLVNNLNSDFQKHRLCSDKEDVDKDLSREGLATKDKDLLVYMSCIQSSILTLSMQPSFRYYPLE
jgi:hypothetical protein